MSETGPDPPLAFLSRNAICRVRTLATPVRRSGTLGVALTPEFSPALTADLKSLTEALEQPDVDIETLLKRLAARTRDAVDSYLGLAITVAAQGYSFTLSTLDDVIEPADIVTSARLPLAALCEGDPMGSIIFYAGVAGAFVDFAADVSHALGLGMDVVALDADLALPTVRGSNRLPDISRLNQAIGILIARGHSHDDAVRELQRLALHDEVPILDAAQRLIGSIHAEPNLKQA